MHIQQLNFDIRNRKTSKGKRKENQQAIEPNSKIKEILSFSKTPDHLISSSSACLNTLFEEVNFGYVELIVTFLKVF